jgi:hypothetical protein
MFMAVHQKDICWGKMGTSKGIFGQKELGIWILHWLDESLCDNCVKQRHCYENCMGK